MDMKGYVRSIMVYKSDTFVAYFPTPVFTDLGENIEMVT